MKRIRTNIFIHRKYISILPKRAYELVLQSLAIIPETTKWNIARVDQSKKTVSFLWYPDFDLEAHPSLRRSMNVDIGNNRTSQRTITTVNPPILHRKETFVEQDYYNYNLFRSLTMEEEKAGLYDRIHSHRIGRKKFWDSLLRQKGMLIVGHKLIKQGVQDINETPKDITTDFDAGGSSMRTTIVRSGPSYPARLSLETELVHRRIFDWGCGKGRDIEFFQEHGYVANGWDPYHRPNAKPESFLKGYFHWVQCVYVLNTIPDRTQRHSILSRIFSFLPSNGHLYIAVRSSKEIDRHAYAKGWKTFKDGWITKKKTFQKGFTPQELESYLRDYHYKNIKIIRTEPVILLATKS